LPRVVEELFVWPAELETVKLAVDERARGRIVQWGRSIENPFPLKQVTTRRLLSSFQRRFSSSGGSQGRYVAVAHLPFLVGSQGLVGHGQDCECEKWKKEKRDAFATHL